MQDAVNGAYTLVYERAMGEQANAGGVMHLDDADNVAGVSAGHAQQQANVAHIKGGKKSLLGSTPYEIANMTRKELQDSLPEGWEFQDHNGRIHIKDENGNYRIRIDPPDKKTNYTHIHIMDENKNPLDINGNIVSPKDTSGHIPYNN